MHHVHHQFHAVGHGTFFTGNIVGENGETFRWVYDCGSRSSKGIEASIGRIPSEPSWPTGTTLDLVVVSHFDNDHVNGLELLLTTYRARWLVLPYLPLKQRLAHATSLGADEVSNTAAAGFAIDPLGWLAARQLTQRVDNILLIEGGGGGDNVPERAEPLPDLSPNEGRNAVPFEDFFEPQDQAGHGHYRLGRGNADPGPRIHRRSHMHAIAPGRGLPMEFVFFNTALPRGLATRSKRNLGEVAQDVQDILGRYCVLDPARARKGWRQALRSCYDRHFGSGGTERNNISLCLVVRPLVEGRQCDCTVLVDPFAWSGACNSIVVDVQERQAALLLTGDLTLDAQTLAALRFHVGDWRWGQLGFVQVPHHGSRHSWFPGNSAKFPNPVFVHCVPTLAGVYPRPHPLVATDLETSRVCYANSEVAVVQTYYLED